MKQVVLAKVLKVVGHDCESIAVIPELSSTNDVHSLPGGHLNQTGDQGKKNSPSFSRAVFVSFNSCGFCSFGRIRRCWRPVF